MEHVIKVDPKLGVRGGGTKPILFPSPFFFSTSTFPVPKSHLHKHNLEKIAMLYKPSLFSLHPQNYGF